MPIYKSLFFFFVGTVCLSVISGFQRHVDDIRALLGYYAASNCNNLPTFRDNVFVLSSRVKKSKKMRKN
jgi:hypothetical protein